MTKCLKAGALLFAAAMAVCAFVMPTLAPAASWGPIGSEHTLDSPNLAFTSTQFGGSAIASCRTSRFTGDVRSAAILTITSAVFSDCTASSIGGFGDCTMTWVGTRFPWVATAPTTTNIQIHDIHFEVTYTDIPGSPGSCGGFVNDQVLTWTGTLAGGQWTGNGAGQHEVIFSNAEGLVEHQLGLGTTTKWTTRATFRDTQQSLSVFD